MGPMLPHSIVLTAADAAASQLPRRLEVSRIWPRSQGRLSLEVVDSQGSPLAGQWIPQPDDRDRITTATRGRAVAPHHVITAGSTDIDGAATGPVLLQLHGADRRLRALPALVAEPGTELVLHRPERRAVLRRTAFDATTYLRVVRPGRTGPLVEAAALSARVVADLVGCTTSSVVSATDEGVITTTALPGRSLRDLGAAAEPRAVGGAAGLGRLLRHLATQPPAASLPVRDATAEAAWLEIWLGRVNTHLPGRHPALLAALASVKIELAATQASATSLIHGDLHDGQVLVAADGGLGVLDWDTVAVGEVALDAANIWAHADLRRLLGQWSAGTADEVWGTVVEAWRPTAELLDRAGAYRRLLLLRLACQYSFRPAHADVVGPLTALAAGQ